MKLLDYKKLQVGCAKVTATAVVLLCVLFHLSPEKSLAADYVQLWIEPENVGTFSDVGQEQLPYTCVTGKGSGLGCSEVAKAPRHLGLGLKIRGLDDQCVGRSYVPG